MQRNVADYKFKLIETFELHYSATIMLSLVFFYFMNYNQRTLIEYKKDFYKRHSQSTVKILQFSKKLDTKNNKSFVFIQDSYGICEVNKISFLIKGCSSIKTAIDKTRYFINQAREVHGDKYDYSLVDYKKSLEKIKIICKEHGVFEQTPASHLFKTGCNKCAIRENGWNKSIWFKIAKNNISYDSFKVYIIECWNEKERFYKIGRTFQTVNNRFKTKFMMPYNYKVLQIFEFQELTQENANKAFDLENELKKLNKENKYNPIQKFNGMCECFKIIKLEKND